MSEMFRGEKKREIYEMIKKMRKISLKEIKASTDINYNTIRSSVISLTKAGLIKRIERGIYKAK
jgi:DeoR/GlpR family transcriptional regulator of sugar metabolism